MNLIGEYPEAKIGFGNMSVVQNYSEFTRSSCPQFVITGTQTGKYAELGAAHYTRVLDYDIDTLKIKMMGAIEASSEPLLMPLFTRQILILKLFSIFTQMRFG